MQHPTSSDSMEGARGKQTLSKWPVGRWVRHDTSGPGASAGLLMVYQHREGSDGLPKETMRPCADMMGLFSCFRGKGLWEGVRREAMGQLL